MELVVEQQAEDGFGILDLTRGDHFQGLVPGDDKILNILAWFASGCSGGQPAGDKKMHPFVQNARSRVEPVQFHDGLAAVAGFLDEFPQGGLAWRFVGFERSRW